MPFTNEDQELAAQNVIDWLTDFFQWETYNEQEIDELGMLHGFTWEGPVSYTHLTLPTTPYV